jgi:hypothetical protein
VNPPHLHNPLSDFPLLATCLLPSSDEFPDDVGYKLNPVYSSCYVTMRQFALPSLKAITAVTTK